MDFNRNLRIVRTSGSSYPFPYKNNVLWVHHDENNKPVAEIWDHGKWTPITVTGSGSGDIIIDTKMSDSSSNAIANKTVKKYIDGVASNADEKFQTKESAAEAEQRVQSFIDTLNSGPNVEGSVKNTVIDAIAEAVASAPEDFETLKEIADYIASDKTGAAQLTAAISQLQTLTEKHTSDIAVNASGVAENKAGVAENKAAVAALKSLIDTMNPGYQFMDVATPETNPGTPDQKVFYIANGKGTYTNFGGINVTEDDVVVLYWDSSWHKVSTGIASQAKLTELEQKTTDIEENIEPVSVTIHTVDGVNGYWHSLTGTWASDNTRRGTEKIDVLEGEKYLITTNIGGSVAIGYLAQWNGDTCVGVSNDFKGGSGNAVDREYIVPNGVTKIAICSYNTTSPSLKKVTSSQVFKAYSKEESDERYAPISSQGIKRYGVKWSITDAEDLGVRCFDAVGLSAEIAIGSIGGHSDFDNIYPWSEMKRCNILSNANGAKVVTFEGEAGFALDGSNGDVFVRIPKFSVEKYIKDGEEYRVISNDSGHIHPAFIEDGKILDEIFISAFEASGNEGVLYSKGGVIPANNITAETFLNYAKAKGVCYSLFDNRCVDLLFTLMSVEFGCRNSNRILGYGYSGYIQVAQYKNWSHCSVSSPSTNTITLGKPDSDSTRRLVLETFAVGQNICICGNAQDGDSKNILAQRKITSISCPTKDDNVVVGFDGEPIAVDAEVEGSANYTYVGNAPITCNNCETISDVGAAMTYHTGRTNRTLSPIGALQYETANACRYRWIENPIGNVWHFLPDVTFLNGQMYICENMRDYVCHKYTSPYKPIGKTLISQISNGNKNDVADANYWIISLMNDIFAKGSVFGDAYDTSLVSTKAFGAYYYLATYERSPVIISHGGGFDHLWRCNILTQRAWQTTDVRWYLYGARLMFKNID